MKKFLVALSMFVSMNANADWHQGIVTVLGFGYDGQTLVLAVAGLNKTTCTCYAPWPANLCVSRSREDFKEIYAFLLKARATREPVQVNIDENTCAVLAIYEAD